MNPQTQNPNDLKIVTFHNKTDFGFTPEMGCMYNGVAIHGRLEGPGINGGESLQVPYHVGKQLALNLAKIAILRTAPRVDPAGSPQGVPLWDDVLLKSMADSYITELYTEEAKKVLTPAEEMMAKIEELKKAGYFETPTVAASPVSDEPLKAEPVVETTGQTITYQDKAEVMAELDKRGVKHNKRSSKVELEKLLA